jgi:hypothetical protein
MQYVSFELNPERYPRRTSQENGEYRRIIQRTIKPLTEVSENVQLKLNF